VVYGMVRSDVIWCVEWTTFAPKSNNQAISGLSMVGALRGFNGMEVISNLCFDGHCSP
jgi:hypothetical protein